MDTKTAQDLLELLLELQKTHNLNSIDLINSHGDHVFYIGVEHFKPELEIRSQILIS